MNSDNQGSRRPGWPVRYGVAALTAIVSYLVLKIPGFAGTFGSVTFLAFLFAAWYGGGGAGLFCVALLEAIILAEILCTRGRPTFENDRDLAAVFLVGAIISGLVEALHRARRRAEAAGREGAALAADEARRKDEFLAMLGHELRNPLAAITNAAQILEMPEAAEDHPWAREMLRRQVGQLIRLVDDLLDVSRIGRGKIRLDRARLDLGAVVHAAVDAARTTIEAQRHDLRLVIPADPIEVDADPTRLEQVIVNLLNNAAKYTEPGGRIEVEARREGDEAVVCVKDTGIGLAPEILPRIFDLFTQADGSLDRSQGGLGIGLSMVQRLVEMHGGRVEAQSDGQGRGSLFIVRLPMTPGPGAG